MRPDWRGKLARPLHRLYRWRGQCVRHMWQGWSMGLRGAPLLLPLLSTAHNQPGNEVLAHQSSAEVSQIPFCLLGKGEWGSGGLVGREKEQGGTTRWINIFNGGRDQAFIEWGQREAFSHTYRVWEKTEMSVSWICFHCHGKAAMGRVITQLLRCSLFFSFLTNVGKTWTCAQTL